MEAQITLEYSDERTADAVARAVSPDNFKVPSGLFVKTVLKGRLVLTEVKAEGSFATFLATIDDLLFCVSVAEKALRFASKV
ncbi:MAG: KEOPS complex subunit Pcc1 [Candidatus Bathyarchaeia archaeon]